MTAPGPLPLLFLDVDGPLIPFGGSPERFPDGYPTYRTGHGAGAAASNPLLARIDPGHGPRLLALPCELVWATTWMDEANECVAPLIGLPQLPVVAWPEPSGADDRAEWDTADDRAARAGVHWKTRALVEWAAGRSFVWVDDEITDADRAWASAHHSGQALLHRVDPTRGLTDADYGTLGEWLHEVSGTPAPRSAP
ncbi:HAD domain-containing protein [Streptomyces uncialis]|uniref:HAD domain-containing protein n=1 Tax=Streptomyces uncialis TaxID=1048205 RepID=UPI002E2F9731|nr:HAD domain-containing protein [Streptomyces uncialis]